MKVCELLRPLQTEQDGTAARADHLREQSERLATLLAETEACPAELTATRKVIDGPTPPDHEPAPAQTTIATVYQRIRTAFNEHPGKVFRVHGLHERLGLPTDEPSIQRHPLPPGTTRPSGIP
ncbi:hypothetical protein ACIO87_33485 [Streptomyces sp. NPDC087218]|uniref:hypothetical protein n=1 Tax=Streptomyces sp. NPDC087218 TaxID=3365769 RepID=UPI0037F5498C